MGEAKRRKQLDPNFGKPRNFNESKKCEKSIIDNDRLINFGDLCLPFFEKHGKGAFINTPCKPFMYATKEMFDSNIHLEIINTNDYSKNVLICEFLDDTNVVMMSFPINECPFHVGGKLKYLQLLIDNSEIHLTTNFMKNTFINK